ncbi:HNH endonuclease [Tenacibaculum sp. 1B UA]|uniref:HNH endonuclease signature motif containing protein n=1 Tax=Tenacibaculum sp. 1B UA TaxID=2922252 RepID=UPI002A23F66B|nr:HNH endonuclease signature motif containing protein [Tenacibaculum sp. 1B UA]MDX8554654.1 HNH endonuclease [Tenacibaculum sp. 1B UA]
MKNYFLFILISLITSLSAYCQETYSIGRTEYYSGKYYSTTGKPMVKRSEANKREFLKSKGYDKIPYGYEIDHIIPLSEGGTDAPNNMQLLTVEQHKRKTARERANRSNSTYSITKPNYYSNSTYNSFYNNNSKPKSTYSGTNNSGRIIYTGSRGGKYYYNSSGKKVYVKSKKSTSNSYYSSPTYSSPSYSIPSSSSSRTIQTGPRGGKYYINSNGNKTYVKKKN